MDLDNEELEATRAMFYKKESTGEYIINLINRLQSDTENEYEATCEENIHNGVTVEVNIKIKLME